MPAVAEVQDMAMLQLVNERRIVDLHQLLVTMIVGNRDEQVQRMAGGKE